MKKSVLFIIPSLELGGTVSSLNSIYKEFCNDYIIDVLPLASTGNAPVLFADRLIPTLSLINYFTANFSELTFAQKMVAVIIKILKRVCHYVDIDIQNFLCKYTIRRVESKRTYDIVVGFQEGISTLVASHSIAKKKIAWVHCNYKYYIVECKNEPDMYSRFDNIVCVSSFTAEAFKSIMPQHGEKMMTIYNLFNETLIHDKANHPIDDNRFDTSTLVLLSVGRIYDIKRTSMIPEVASILNKSHHDFKWYIIGPVVQEDEFNMLKENIKKYNLHDKVIWLDYKSNPYPYIKAADLFVCLSISEACPMVFNEAKMLGTPIITTDFGSAHEFIKNGENGFICDIDHIGEKIKEYADNYDLRHDISTMLYHQSSPNKGIMASLRTILG